MQIFCQLSNRVCHFLPLGLFYANIQTVQCLHSPRRGQKISTRCRCLLIDYNVMTVLIVINCSHYLLASRKWHDFVVEFSFSPSWKFVGLQIEGLRLHDFGYITLKFITEGLKTCFYIVVKIAWILIRKETSVKYFYVFVYNRLYKHDSWK